MKKDKIYKTADGKLFTITIKKTKLFVDMLSKDADGKFQSISCDYPFLIYSQTEGFKELSPYDTAIYLISCIKRKKADGSDKNHIVYY